MLPGAGRLAVAVGQILGQRVQILAVALERVRRSAALDAQVLQELADLRTHGRGRGSEVEGQRIEDGA